MAAPIRTALTQDMWEALNDGWRQLGQMDAETALRNLPSLLEWTKNRTAAFRGATEGSLLRNDGYFFLRMGGLIERADMTLRLLDVKYYVLLPETDVVGGGRDYHQWTSVLARDLGPARLSPRLQGRLHALGHRRFPDPQRDVPALAHISATARSRTFSTSWPDLYGERRACQDDRRATMVQRLDGLGIEELFQSGLHEFVSDAIETDTASVGRDQPRLSFLGSHASHRPPRHRPTPTIRRRTAARCVCGFIRRPSTPSGS